MAELIRNGEAIRAQDSRKNLIAESQLGSGDALRVSYLHNLSYLQACVKETLRLHPPAPRLLPRRATQNCEVMGYVIPKYSQVLVNVWAVGRDHNIWEDPPLFKAEWFLSTNSSALDFKGNDFELLPFGGGRRICSGLPLAARQIIHQTLANLVYHFEWSLPRDMAADQQHDMTQKYGVNLEREQPLMLIPKRRW